MSCELSKKIKLRIWNPQQDLQLALPCCLQVNEPSLLFLKWAGSSRGARGAGSSLPKYISSIPQAIMTWGGQKLTPSLHRCLDPNIRYHRRVQFLSLPQKRGLTLSSVEFTVLTDLKPMFTEKCVVDFDYVSRWSYQFNCIWNIRGYRNSWFLLELAEETVLCRVFRCQRCDDIFAPPPTPPHPSPAFHRGKSGLLGWGDTKLVHDY